MQRPIACWQCGTVVSATGGRCPTCGVEQSTAPGGDTAGAPRSLRPRLGTPVVPGRRSPRAWLVLVGGLGSVAVLGVWFAPRTSTPAIPGTAPGSSGSASTTVSATRVEAPRALDPLEALATARARAIAWHPDALLLSLRAAPVGEHGVDLETGGSVEYVFGRPGREGFGAGAHVGQERLTVRLTRDGERTKEQSGGAGRVAIEPNCPFEEALKRARASGLPSRAPLVVHYEFSDQHARSVYRVTVSGDAATTRALDGQTCAILVR